MQTACQRFGINPFHFVKLSQLPLRTCASGRKNILRRNRQEIAFVYGLWIGSVEIVACFYFAIHIVHTNRKSITCTHVINIKIVVPTYLTIATFFVRTNITSNVHMRPEECSRSESARNRVNSWRLWIYSIKIVCCRYNLNKS